MQHRNKTKISTLLGLTLLTTSFASFADDKKLGWSGTGEAGYINTTGNKDSETLNAKLKAKYAQETRDFSALLEAEHKAETIEETKETLSERYVAEFQADQYFNSARTFYGFANIRGEQDKPVDLNSDLNTTIGLGKVLYETKASLLKGELGAGYQKVKFKVATEDNFNQTIGRAKLDFTHKLNDSLTFKQDALYIYGSEQYKIETNTGLRASLTSSLAAGVNYKYRHNSNPGDENKKDDGELSLNLIYNF